MISFRDNKFENPRALLQFLMEPDAAAKVRPDQRVLFLREFDELADRLKGTTAILRKLARLAGKAAA